MTAVWQRARADIAAHRWRLLALVVLTGLFGSVVLASAAGARRTESSFRRFLADSSASEVEVGNNLDPDVLAAVAKLPEVKQAVPYSFFIMAPENVPGRPESVAGVSVGIPTDGRWLRTVDRPRVLSGRMPEPSAANEIAVNEAFARARHVGVGDAFRFHAYSLEQLYTVIFAGRQEAPAGPIITTTIVGLVRHPIDLTSGEETTFQNAYGTPALWRAHSGDAANFGVNLAVTLRRGEADSPAFRARVEKMASDFATAGREVELFAQSRRPAYAPGEDTVRIEALAVAIFAGLLAITTVMVLGQALSRWIRSVAHEHGTLRALGMSRAQLIAVCMAPASIVVIAGLAAGIAAAVIGSRLFPLGFSSAAEPHPGIALDATVMAIGASALGGLLLARALLGAFRASATGEPASVVRPSVVGDAMTRAGLPASVAIGTRMALEPARGRTGVSVRTALVGAVVALGAMTAAIGLASSIDHLVRTPRLYGTNWDVAMNGGDDPASVPEVTRNLNGTRGIAEFSSALLADVFINGRRTQSFGIRNVKGNVFLSMVEGHQPRGAGEIALGTETMRALGVKVGGSVVVAGGTSVRMKVVGRAVFPGMDDDTIGDGAAMDTPAFESMKPEPDFPIFFLRLGAGDHDAIIRDMIKRFGVTNVHVGERSEKTLQNELFSQPPTVVNLRRVQDLPPQLADLLLLLAVATVAHAIVTSVRERRREIAILKTMGFVRRQAASVVAAQATTFMMVALVLGIPLGFGVSKWVWSGVAGRVGFIGAPVVDVAALVIYAVGVLAVANLVAAVPGRSAARSRPSLVLRAE